MSKMNVKQGQLGDGPGGGGPGSGGPICQKPLG